MSSRSEKSTYQSGRLGMNINPEMLTESKVARNDYLVTINQVKAQELLAKAKAMIWAMWQGAAIATTEQMAEFYEVPNSTVRQVLKRHRDEFESDGVKVLRGKALKDVSFKLSLTPKTPNLTAWTPRAGVRLGLLLRDSQVAAFIRTVVLDIVEESNRPPEPPQTNAEFLLMFAQQMVSQEKRLAEQESELRQQKTILSDLLAEKQAAEEELFALPTADEPAKKIPIRGKINMVVRNYAHRTGTGYKAVWDGLYLQMYYRYSYDVKARCRHSGRKKLDQVEADRKLEELFAIASETLI